MAKDITEDVTFYCKAFPLIYPALLLIRDLLDLVGLVVFRKNAGGV